MGFVLALAWENKRLLLSESLPKSEERERRTLVEGWDGVTRIVDFWTVFFGPDNGVVAADVAFDPALDTGEIDDRISAIEDTLTMADDAIVKVYIEPEP